MDCLAARARLQLLFDDDVWDHSQLDNSWTEIMLRLDDLDSLHALIEQGRVRFCPTRLEKYAYIGKDYPAPTQPRPRDPIRDVLFPKREPGWLLQELLDDWSWCFNNDLIYDLFIAASVLQRKARDG